MVLVDGTAVIADLSSMYLNKKAIAICDILKYLALTFECSQPYKYYKEQTIIKCKYVNSSLVLKSMVATHIKQRQHTYKASLGMSVMLQYHFLKPKNTYNIQFSWTVVVICSGHGVWYSEN